MSENGTKFDEAEPLAAILAEARNKFTVHDCNECDYRKSCDLRFDCDECKTKRKSISLAFGIEDDYFAHLLDRIEAAYKREHASWHAETDAAKDDRNRVACRMRSEFAEKCRNCTERATGNAVAMREALEKIARWDDGIGADISNIARAAFAAPPRNCDVGTAVKQAERQSRFCMSQAGRCTTCPADRPTHNACVLAWAQMPFAPTEGKEAGHE